MLTDTCARIDPVEIAQVDDIKEQLAKAERELLEARASCSLQRKAVEAVLMTDPAIQSIHSTDKTVIEKYEIALDAARRSALVNDLE